MRRIIIGGIGLALGAAACTAASADSSSPDPEAGVEREVSEEVAAVTAPTSTTTVAPASEPDADSAPSAVADSDPATTEPDLGPTPRAASGGVGSGMGSRLASDGTPTFDGDFADPDVLHHEGTFYAYATNTMFMNVPVLSASPSQPSTLVGDALPELPAWSEPHHVWAPSVTPVGDTFVLHYTTRHSASGRQCISVAIATDPAGPFVDDSDEPLVCPLDQGGAIDPSVALDGEALWLLWKSDGNCCGLPTIIYAQPLTADGTGLAGDPVELIRNDLSWERDVVEGPSMIEVDGIWHLFYSANRWDTADYAVGHAVCETVTGPCVKDPEPWLASTDGTAGPGGLEVIELADRPNDLVVYHGWTGGEVGYPDGARALYARVIRWVDGQPVLVGR